MLQYLFADESGDLGFIFDLPYRNGGSSRHITLAGLAINPVEIIFIKRFIRNLYKKYPTYGEKKYSKMRPKERADFVVKANKLLSRHSDIKLFAIVARKKNIPDYIKKRSELIYNHMNKVLWVPVMGRYELVTYFPDQRSIKKGSSNSLRDSLQESLWFDSKKSTILTMKNTDSKSNLILQFADMIAGTVQSHYEDGVPLNLDINISHIFWD